MSPQFSEYFARVEDVFAGALELFFIPEIVAEEADVVVRSVCGVAIFPTREIPNFLSRSGAQSFEEFLQMRFVKAAVGRQFRVVISECQETIFGVAFCFMGTANGPVH